MILVNKLKINLVTTAYFTPAENEILEFIRNEIKDLIIFTHVFYPNNVFYFNKSNEIVLEKDLNILYVRLEGFWKVLRNKYDINNKDTQELLIFIMEHEMNISPSIIYGMDLGNPEVESLYKNKDKTDDNFFSKYWKKFVWYVKNNI